MENVGRGGSTMLTNRQIRKIINEWKKECGGTHTILFRYRWLEGELIICTDKPGYMIGLRGEKAFKYERIFKSLDKEFKNVHFIETDGIA